MNRRRSIAVGTVCAVAAPTAGTVSLAGWLDRTGQIGPALRITPNGRLLRPPGVLVGLGHFPTGGAVTPDGRY